MFVTTKSTESLHSICMTIAWATTYAPKNEPLNETHPVWPEYFAYSEWFRHRICAQLMIPLDTEWEVIYKLVGCMVDEEYATPEDAEKARSFGFKIFLLDEMADYMFNKFEEIKFRIVKRI